MLKKLLLSLALVPLLTSVAFAQVDEPEEPRGQAGTPTFHFIGDRYRIGVGLDSEFDVIGELEAALYENDRSSFIFDGWLGNRQAAGIKLNYHWLIRARTEEGPNGPVNVDGSVAKLFVAADQNQLRDRKLTFGGGWEGERWAFAGYGMRALTSERLVDTSMSFEERLMTGQIDGHDFSRVDTIETIIQLFEEPYDWGLGLRGERFFAEPLVRLRGGMDYERGDYSSSQTTASLSLDKHFRNSPHSVSLRTSYARKRGDFVDDRSDLRGSLVYGYAFGGSGAASSSWRQATGYETVEVSVPGQTRSEERVVINEVTMTDRTTFDFDSSALRPEARRALDQVVTAMQQGGLVGTIQIVGHTCDIGTEAYNQGLSERRASAVVDYLVSQGVGSQQIAWEGHGELDPRYPNDSDENRARNRRVEISFVTERKSTEMIQVGDDQPTTELRQVEVPVEAPWIRRALRNPVRHKRIVDYYRYQTSTTSVTEGVMQIENALPQANDDQYIVDSDSVDNSFDVLANDTDADGDVLTLIAVGQPVHGQASLSGNYVLYTPHAGFFGNDQFTYTVEDGFGGESSATVRVTVLDTSNTPPVANDIDITTREDEAVNIDVLASASDADGDVLSIAGYSQPAHGSVSESGGLLTYTPDSGYTGADEFLYTVTDGRGGEASGRVHILVLAGGDGGGPVGGLKAVPDEYHTQPGQTRIVIQPMENDSGEGIHIVDMFQWYGPAADFEVREDGSVVVELTLHCDGRHHFNYTIQDVHGDQDSANITIIRVDAASPDGSGSYLSSSPECMFQ